MIWLLLKPYVLDVAPSGHGDGPAFGFGDGEGYGENYCGDGRTPKTFGDGRYHGQGGGRGKGYGHGNPRGGGGSR
jgi:hypothetical protein